MVLLTSASAVAQDQDEVTEEVAVEVTEGWTLAVGADNLTDEYPERSNNLINYFGHLPHDVLSPIGMNGAYFYFRTQYDF